MSLEDRIVIFLAENPKRLFTASEINTELNLCDTWGVLYTLKHMAGKHLISPIPKDMNDSYVMGYTFNINHCYNKKCSDRMQRS